MWWHIRRSAFVYVIARVVLTMSLAWAQAPFVGIDTSLFAIVLAAILVPIDGRRTGAPLLLQNAGISTAERIVASVPFAILGESAILVYSGLG